MRQFHLKLGAVILCLVVLVSACAPKSEPVISEGPPLPAVGDGATEPATSDDTVEPQFPRFDASKFGNSTTINNKWAPMQPGTYWAYEGSAVQDGENVSRRIEFTVTDLTKEINGVRTVAAWIVDYTNGKMEEKELAFYAQDNDGNVWYFGEHPEDYQDGKFVDAPTWIAGIQGAKPGIKMQADPKLATSSIYQGWGPEVEWSDFAQVDQVEQKACVPVNCYENVLVIAESSLGEEGAYQLKYYAQGVGNIQVGWRGTDEAQEELKLVEYKQLSPDALADVRTQALDLEKHAYEVSKDVYGKTPPLEPMQ